MSTRKRDVGLAILITAMAVVLGQVVRQTDFMSEVERRMVFRLSRGIDDSRFGQDVVVVALDQYSWYNENPFVPMDRGYLAAVLNVIGANANPRAIGIDVLLDEPLSGERAHEDEELAESLRRLVSPVVLAVEKKQPKVAGAFQGKPLLGHIEVETAKGNVIDAVSDPVETSFSGRLRRAGSLPEVSHLPSILFPRARQVDIYSANDLFSDLASGNAKQIAHMLTGKIVLIGSSSPEKGDLHNVPTEAYGKAHMIPGVLVQAHAVASRLPGAPVYLPWLNMLLASLASGVAVWLSYSFSGWKLGLGLALSCLVFGAVTLAFVIGNLIVNPIPALFTGVAGCAAWTWIRRMRLDSGYRSLVGERVHRSLREVAELERIAPSEQEVSILFADLVGFGRFSRTREPGDVLEAVNQTLGPLADLVVAHGGVVDRFTGDGILAIFGAPFPGRTALTPQESALRAVRCGLQMIRHVVAVSEQEIGVGINTGRVSSGLMGGKSFRQFVVMGEAVNDAARIEAISHLPDVQPLENRILVSEATARLIQPEYRTKPKTYRSVKEFNEPVYEIKEGGM